MLVVWIEDEAVVRSAIARSMKRLGCSSRLFDSAQQFWESQETITRPFVLICDRILQDAAGEQVCREARNSFGLDVYVVLTSGYPKDCVDLSCCDAFLAKPWALRDFEALLARVRDESL